MKINPDTRTVTLEPASKPCRLCYGRGRTIVPQPCPTNGRGPRGGKDGCRTCHGSKRHYDPAVTEVCGRCNGVSPDRHEDETRYDHLSFAAFRDLVEWRVVDATDTRFTQWGTLLGEHGAITTVVDYGAHTRMTDEELVAAVRDGRDSTQGVNVVSKDLVLCDAIVIARRQNGYSVRAVWDDLEPAAAA